MALFKKFIITTIIAVSTIAPMQALTAKDFYFQCAEIPECAKVNIPKLLLKLKNRHLSELKIVDAENLDYAMRQKVLTQLNQIETGQETTVIKNSEDGEISHIFIEPKGIEMDILITNVEQSELSVVYIRCNKKLVNKIIKEYSK